MNLRISGLIVAFAFAGILGSAQSLAENAYVTLDGIAASGRRCRSSTRRRIP
jgi:hypothetical protein